MNRLAVKAFAPRVPAIPDRPARGSHVLSARGVAVHRGQRTILDRVDVDVVAGEILALVGPNGAGKSTLLSVLAGDEAPTSGSVHLGGRPLASWSAREAALRRAVLPQQNVLSFPFLVRDVVTMGRAPWRDTPLAERDDAVVADAMIAAAVEDLAERRFTTLSGGEAARVSLARVLAQRTAVLLLDEPTAALDPHHQESVFALLRQQADYGDAVIVVVHDLNLAAAYADQVAVLADGQLQARGRPDAVLTDELLSRAYGHPMEVVSHPRTGRRLIAPRR